MIQQLLNDFQTDALFIGTESKPGNFAQGAIASRTVTPTD